MAKHVPQRMCVICREMKAKSELIRVVRRDNEISVDTSGRKPGRGMYFCLDKETIDELFRAKRLEKLLKQSLPDEAKERLETELRTLLAEREAALAKENRPEIVTYDEAGRKIRLVPKAKQ